MKTFPTLVQVQVFFRHGSRTPLHHVMSPAVKEAFWTEDMIEDLPHTMFPHYLVDHCSGERFEFDHPKLIKSYRLPGGCLSGELTKIGQEEMFQLGKLLKARYIDDQAFLSRSKCPTDLHARSTRISRTLRSIRCVLAGLYGDSLHEEGHTEPVPVDVETLEREFLFPNPHTCGAMSKLYLDGTAEYTASRPHQELKRRLNLCLGLDRLMDDFEIRPTLTDCPIYFVRDDYVSRERAGFPLPTGLAELMPEMDLLSSEELKWELLGKKSEWATNMSLVMGSVFCLVLTNMKRHEIVPKFHLYAVHDSTLMPMLYSLGDFDRSWSPFAAYITFELYHCPGSTSPDDHFSDWMSSTDRADNMRGMGLSSPKPFDGHLDTSTPSWSEDDCRDMLVRVLYLGKPIPLACLWKLQLSDSVPEGFIPLRILVEYWSDSLGPQTHYTGFPTQQVDK